ncbi:hypothetical protein [Rhodococcus artemisiae]|uniref:Uncharacterized protein n=1 Tax=Rhodococcus artemisiae TaxID=714159 RepID=A0ABU7L4H2_9NOCA|nr:hypothetical protein [Rhodococcus artemisiae]MEE2056439.1 hypothetical protein [Rhodococcus artemisiae]
MSRRTLLRWCSAAAGGVSVAAVTGCGVADDELEPDPLLAQAARARTDASTATALVALVPDLSEPLTMISSERTAHADALEAEIARAAGATTSYTPPSSTTTTAAAGQAPTVELLRESLVRSQRSAGDVGRTLQGFRAGMLASISAACAVQTAVLLP